jgi:hypothetical protein
MDPLDDFCGCNMSRTNPVYRNTEVFYYTVRISLIEIGSFLKSISIYKHICIIYNDLKLRLNVITYSGLTKCL